MRCGSRHVVCRFVSTVALATLLSALAPPSALAQEPARPAAPTPAAPAAPATPPRPPQYVSPEVGADGRVTFRIHAPNAQAVRLSAGDIVGLTPDGRADDQGRERHLVGHRGHAGARRLPLQLQRRRRRDDRPAQPRDERVVPEHLERRVRARRAAVGHHRRAARRARAASPTSRRRSASSGGCTSTRRRATRPARRRTRCSTCCTALATATTPGRRSAAPTSSSTRSSPAARPCR